MSLEQGIVRILQKNKPVGMGFVVGERQIITCVHVLDPKKTLDAIPTTVVTIDFPFVEKNPQRQATITIWDREHDIAGLELIEGQQLPETAETISLVSRESIGRCSLRLFGCPANYPHGVWVGEVESADFSIMGRTSHNRWQITPQSDEAYKVQPGFSGTPVYDTTLKCVIGMAVAADKSVDNPSFFIIPAQLIADSWPSIVSLPDLQNAPYQGLLVFEEKDANRFFGRDALIKKIWDHLDKEWNRPNEREWGQLLIIVGASGSGKSSLTRAGLLPLFRQAGWTIHLITPTAHPLESLATTLTKQYDSVNRTQTLIDDLQHNPRALHLYTRKLLGNRERLLLVIDQFEETFTQCKNESERKAFIDNLMTAVQRETAGAVHLILTLRADFYHHCANYPELREALEQRQHYIGAMNAAELGEAIEKPVKGIYHFEEGLISQIIRDCGCENPEDEKDQPEPGALPLLSHALLELWKRREGTKLTLKGYAEAGRVQGALAKTAEALRNELDASEQSVIRNIFLRLTELGEGTQDTRRRIDITELGNDSATYAMLQRLVEKRLVTLDDGSAEVAHEALIREWPILRQWLDEDREGLLIHRRLTEAVKQWVSNQKDDSYLHYGNQLVNELAWYEQHTDLANQQERDFLQASKRREREEARILAEANERDLYNTKQLLAEQQIRGKRNQQWLAFAIVLMTILATVSGFAIISRQEAVTAKNDAVEAQGTAEAEAKTAKSRGLAGNSQLIGNNNTLLAMLLAIQAYKTENTSEAYLAMQQALARPHLIARQSNISFNTFYYNNLQWNSDSSRFLTFSFGGNVQIWDGKTGKPLFTLQAAKSITETEIVNYQAFFATWSPDGSKIVATSTDNATRWDREGKFLQRIPHQTVIAAEFSPDGTKLALGGDSSILIWNMQTDQEEQRISLSKDYPLSLMVRWSPDGKKLLGVYSKNEFSSFQVTGWKIEDTNHQFLFLVSSESMVYQPELADKDMQTAISDLQKYLFVEWSPNGQQFATKFMTQGIPYIWDGETGELIMEIKYSSSTAGRYTYGDKPVMVTGIDWNKDGSQLLTMNAEWNEISAWDITTQKRTLFLPHTASFKTFAFLSWQEDEEYVLIAGVEYLEHSKEGEPCSPNNKASVQLWHLPTSKMVWYIPIEQGCDGPFVISSISPDQKRLAIFNASTLDLYDVSNQAENVYSLPAPIHTLFSYPQREPRYFSIGTSVEGENWLWDSQTPDAPMKKIIHEPIILADRFSPNSEWLATAAGDEVRITKSSTGELKYRLEHHSCVVRSVEWSKDNNRLITSCQDGIVRVWDVKNKTTLSEIQHGDPTIDNDFPTVAVWNRDETEILTGGQCSKTIKVWDTKTGQQPSLLREKSASHPPFLLTWAGQADQFIVFTTPETMGCTVYKLNGETNDSANAVTTTKTEIAVWDKEFNEDSPIWHRQLDNLSATTFNRERTKFLFYTPNTDYVDSLQEATIVDVATGETIISLEESNNGIQAVSWHRTESLVALLGYDGQVAVYNTDDGKLVATYIVVNNFVVPQTKFSVSSPTKITSIGWATDALVFGTDTGSLHVQPILQDSDLIEQACKAVWRNMTLLEWQENIGIDVPYQTTCDNLPVHESVPEEQRP